MDAMTVSSALGNVVTAAALALAGGCALAIATRRSRRHILPFRLALLAGIGLIFLAADEGLEVHDRAGRWLYEDHGVVAPGPMSHVDDLFIIAYVALGAGLLAYYAPRLLRTPRLLAGFVAAGALFAAAASFDTLGAPGTWTDAFDEGFEAGGALLLAAVFGREAFGLHHLAAAKAFLAESPVRGTAKGGARELESKAPSDSGARLRPMSRS